MYSIYGNVAIQWQHQDQGSEFLFSSFLVLIPNPTDSSTVLTSSHETRTSTLIK